MRFCLVAIIGLICTPGMSSAQDIVRSRTRSAKGELSIQELQGTIESESIAGIRLSGSLIPAANIIDVEYETPGSIRIDVREAKQSEDSRKNEDAIRKFRALAASPGASNNIALKRHFEFKAASLMATMNEHAAAVAAVDKWIHDYPESWQRLAATRMLVRLHLDAEPPAFDAAHKALSDLAAASGAGPAMKTDCQLAIVDLLLRQRKAAPAAQILEGLPIADHRVAAYRIAVAADAANPETAIHQLEELLPKSDDRVKGTIYNLLGDCRQLDPKKSKDALFAYLWVDLVYNVDPVETAKARERLADLFKKMGQEERAKSYRDKARGQS